MKRASIILASCATNIAATLLLSFLGPVSQWAQEIGDRAPQSIVASSSDSQRGKAVFEKRCTGCHALDQDREGPHLRDVYGRTAGTVRGVDYSDGLKNSHIVWNEATLDRWLTDPQTMIPGANMDFFVAKPDERADVIEFLKEESQQSGSNPSR